MTIKKADRFFSVYIRMRDKGRCFTCGKVENWKYQEAGHYIPRENTATRYDERSVNCQCHTCNCFKHGNMDEYALRLKEKYGEGILEELNKLKHQIKRFKSWELQEIIDVCKIRTKALKRDE